MLYTHVLIGQQKIDRCDWPRTPSSEHQFENRSKLEAQIDDLDAQLEAEKKIRLDMERSKRQVELNHRMASETIIDLENDKARV